MPYKVMACHEFRDSIGLNDKIFDKNKNNFRIKFHNIKFF